MTQHDTKAALTNTEILFFICGYQGGTVHQLAEMLGTVPNDILWATPSRMGELMRLAQTYRNKRDLGSAAQDALKKIASYPRGGLIEIGSPEEDRDTMIEIARQALYTKEDRP